MSDEGKPLDARVAELVRYEKGAPGPSAAAKGRMLAKLDLALDGAGGGGEGGPEGTAKTGGSSMRSAGVVKGLSLGMAFVVGSVFGAFAVRAMTSHAAAPEVRVVYVERVAQPAVVVDAGELDDLTLAPQHMPSARRASPPQAASSQARADTLDEERAILDGARIAVGRGDGAAANLALAKHEARYATGMLTEEREALRVQSLVLLGRMEEARLRAQRFRGRYPGSVLTSVVDAAIQSNP